MSYIHTSIKRQTAAIRSILALIFICMICMTGCGKDVERAVSLQEERDETMMIDDYVAAYQDVNYRKMWKMWPKWTFGGKVNVLADMKKDIFKARYGDETKLVIDRGEIVKGNDEDEQAVLDYFSFAEIKYVTDVHRCDYTATLEGGKKDGKTFKEGVIYAFRFGGFWYVYDD